MRHLSFAALTAAVLTACSGQPDSTVPLRVPGEPAAAPQPTRAPTPGRITGTVDVPAHADGPVFVGAAQGLSDMARGNVAALSRVTPTGTFSLDGLQPGAYFVAAFIDANRDGYPDRRSEAYVLWPDPVVVDAGATVADIALANFLNLPNPAVRTAERRAAVERMQAAAEAALQDLMRHPPEASAHADRLLPTIRIAIHEVQRLWARADSEATWEFAESTLQALPEWAAAATRGEDPLAERRGWQLLGFMRPADGAVQPYLLYVPPNYDPGTPTPLVIGLHGGGGTHWSAAHMVVGAGGMDDYGPKRESRVWPPAPAADMLVATPIGDQGGMAWRRFGELNVLAVLDHVTRRYAVDQDRVYLTGLSDGGRGAWEIGVRFPDRFAAILVGAGGTEMAQLFAMNVAHVPIRVVHGAHDRVIPVRHARTIVEVGTRFNMNIEYEEVDRGHNIADICYADGKAFTWFAQHRRKPVPAFVRFRTDHVLYGRGPGVAVMAAAEPQKYMDVQVRWIDDQHVSITSKNVTQLTVRVPPGEDGPVSVLWNGQAQELDHRPEAISLRYTGNPASGVAYIATPGDTLGLRAPAPPQAA